MKHQPASVLVICTRRIGDVLLTTPLIRSIRRAWPQAAIDALVFDGTEGILQGNPDLRQVLTVPQHPDFQDHARLAARLYRRYDLAISTLTSDRPTLYAWLAGRYRIGLTDPGRPSRIKQHMLHASLPLDNLNTHTVRMNLMLTDLLGIDPVAEVVVNHKDAKPLFAQDGLDLSDMPYAVLHTYPKYPYKQWREEGWVAVSQWLAGRGIRTVLTGGPELTERNYVASLAQKMPLQTLNLAGRVNLSDTAAIIQGAVAYVGPDTATTHLAAATGILTVALYGPSNPVKWGPWPKGWPAHRNPFVMQGNQQCGNVTLLQGTGDCVPCMNEGCQQHVRSTSDCLTRMTAMQVIQALDNQLKQRDAAVGITRNVCYGTQTSSMVKGIYDAVSFRHHHHQE